MTSTDGIHRWDAPLTSVRPEWVDHYGHMNMGFYLVAFDLQTDRLWRRLGLGAPLQQAGVGTFAVEAWLDYQRELLDGMALGAESEVLATDAKRLLVMHRLFHWADGWTASEHEVLYLCVDLITRRAGTWPGDIAARLAGCATGQAGRRLTLARRSG